MRDDGVLARAAIDAMQDARVAAPEDSLDDPTSAWPEAREVVAAMRRDRAVERSDTALAPEGV